MKYFYCLKDKVKGMQTCGLSEKHSSIELEVTQANKTIEVTNIPRSTGASCYYTFKFDETWDREKTYLYLYPFD